MRDTPIPYQQVFISYSHADEPIATKISTDLRQRSITTWIDRSGLPSGTPNWDTAIRDALQHSFAFLLIASPQAGKSNVVYGEIASAKRLGIPIYPLWIQDDEWSECIPLEMAHTQYIDCRGESYATGIAQIATVLRETLTSRRPKHCLYTGEYLRSHGKLTLPLDYLLIYLRRVSYSHTRSQHAQSITIPPAQDVQGDTFIALCPHAFPTLRALLDDLYGEYLKDRYDPYTYGKDWILESCKMYSFGVDPRRLIVPWEWLAGPSDQPLASYYHTWADSSPDCYELSDLQIMDGPLKSAFGIATNNHEIANLLSDRHDSKRIDYLFRLLHTPTRPRYSIPGVGNISIKAVEAATVNIAQYRYQFVFMSSAYGRGRRAFIVD